MAGPISALLHPRNTAPFQEMSRRWRAVGNTVYDLICASFERKSRTPTETQSESTRSSDFLIFARLKFTKLVHCCILFITKCLCHVFRKLANNHTKLELKNHSSVSILAAFFWCSRLYRFEPWTSRYRDESVTARPTGRY